MSLTTAKTLTYRCPCGQEHLVEIKLKAHLQLTLHKDLTTNEQLVIEDAEIIPVIPGMSDLVQGAIDAYKVHDNNVARECFEKMNPEERDMYITAIRELNANRSD